MTFEKIFNSALPKGDKISKINVEKSPNKSYSILMVEIKTKEGAPIEVLDSFKTPEDKVRAEDSLINFISQLVREGSYQEFKESLQ